MRTRGVVALTVGVAVVCGALLGVALRPPDGADGAGAPRTRGRIVARGDRRAGQPVASSPAAHTPGPAPAGGVDGRIVLSQSVMTPFGPPRPTLAVDAILGADQDAAWKVGEVARLPRGGRSSAIAMLAAALGRDPSIAEALAMLLRTATGDELDVLTQVLREGAAFQARDEIRPAALDVLRHDPDEARRIAAAWALRYAGGDPLPAEAQREILAAFREERSWRVVAALGESVTGGISRESLAAALDDVLARIEPGAERVRISDARWNGARTGFSVLLQRFEAADSQDERDAVAAEIVGRAAGRRTVGVRRSDSESWADRVARQSSRQASFLRVYAGTSDASIRSRLLCDVADTPWDCFDAVRGDAEPFARAYCAFLREVAAIEPVEGLAERLRSIAERVESGGERASAADFRAARKGG